MSSVAASVSINNSLPTTATSPNIAPGMWIGGFTLPGQRVSAISLEVTSNSRILGVWLKTGQLKTLSMTARRTNGPTFDLHSANGIDTCRGTLDPVEIRGECSLGSENLRGAIDLVLVADGPAAIQRYNQLWQQGFLGPETYHYLASLAAKRGDINQALLWLDRGRRAKRPMSDALLFEGHELDAVRRDERFRGLLKDPVAAYPELSQATYTVRIDRNVWIPMRDKVRLLADIYRPDLPGQFPIILIRGPYGRGADIPPEGVDHFAARGYVVVIQAVRGTDGSEGKFEPWINEREDGYDTVDWVSKQRWSNGKVGMMGLSYLGQTQWAAAVEAHPALKCILPEVSGTDHMLDTPYEHGILRLEMLPWSFNFLPRPKGQFSKPNLNDAVLTSLPLSALDRVYTGQSIPMWQQMLDLDRESKWRSNFLSDLNRIHIPVLNISGWWDGEATATTTNYTAMRNLGRKNQWLIYGPWEHVWNQSSKFKDQEYGPTATIDFKSLAVRWFDQWLKGKAVRFENTPKVQVFVTGRNQWMNLDSWPDSRARPLILYLSGTGGSCESKELAPSPASHCSNPHQYVYDPSKVNPLSNGPIPDSTTAIKIDPSATDMVSYESEPFDSPTTITGPGKLDLYFSTSANDVDFFIVVFDRDVAGVARAIAGPGKMGMRYIDGWDSPHPLDPDRIYHGAIDLRPFAHEFGKGHRLGIMIRSEWFPGYVRNLNTGESIKDATRMEIGTEKIYHDALRPSTLRLWLLNSN